MTWDGFPENRKVSWWHWLTPLPLTPHYWNAAKQCWKLKSLWMSPTEAVAEGYAYMAPCVDPMMTPRSLTEQEQHYRRLLRRVLAANIAKGCKPDHPRIRLIYDIQDAVQATREEAAEMCRKRGTKQCAPICLSHSNSIPLGQCPALTTVWTDAAVQLEQERRGVIL